MKILLQLNLKWIYIVIILLVTFPGCRMSVEQAAITEEGEPDVCLMTYFKPERQGVYFALSRNGYNFVDINNGMPVITGDTNLPYRYLHDSHLYKGEDNIFYMVITASPDIRGSGKISSFILMRSADLIDWIYTCLPVEEIFPDHEDISRICAPKIIHDSLSGKMMIYFTLQYEHSKSRLYYMYADEDFANFELPPRPLFDPLGGNTCIQADINKVGDNYILFYISGTPEKTGIRKAVSSQLHTGYVYEDRWYDFETVACSSPNVWKRTEKDKWVLMYGVDGITTCNLAFCETGDFENFTYLGHFNEGVMRGLNFDMPRKASVSYVSATEAAKLASYWNASAEF